jgi:hypothetical protein
VNILDVVAVELLCPACKGRYAITLKQVLLSEQMLHQGCPVPMEYTSECPPLYYAHLSDCGLIQELEQIWLRLEAYAGAGGGKLVLVEGQSQAKPDSGINE